MQEFSARAPRVGDRGVGGLTDVGPGVAVPAAGDLLHEQARVVEDAGNSTAVKQLSRAANSGLLFTKI